MILWSFILMATSSPFRAWPYFMKIKKNATYTEIFLSSILFGLYIMWFCLIN